MASLGATGVLAQHGHGSEGVGTAHMETSCAPAVQAQFDRALCCSTTFGTRAPSQVSGDPKGGSRLCHGPLGRSHDLQPSPLGCADSVRRGGSLEVRAEGPQSQVAERSRANVPLAVAALYKDAGAGTKRLRDEAYRDRMAATHAQYPDDEAALFYGLSIIGSISEGTKGFEMQGRAVALFESVYARDRQHPGGLHYLISLRRPRSCRAWVSGGARLRKYGRGGAARVSHAVAHLHAPGLLGGSGEDQRERVENLGG